MIFLSLDKKGQGSNKQKTNHQILRLPPVKSLQGSKPRAQSATMNCIRQLRSQVWDLQQQLSDAKTENKLLKTVQHRHTVALQHFHDSESSISQVGVVMSPDARAHLHHYQITVFCLSLLIDDFFLRKCQRVPTSPTLKSCLFWCLGFSQA